ncbi:MAG TPA: POTRA domain-containing protein [Blastocatellia bacterium]|nr:POTRA domain-containing protein [Blastocatellia bacterium]
MQRQESPIKRLALACLLLFAFCLSPAVRAQTAEFLGRRVTSVTVEIEGAPGSNVTEMQTLIDVTPGRDYSPVGVHDSLVRLFHSGLIANARVEATADGAAGVALRFVVRPRARIDSVVFAGTPIFPVSELQARLNQLDPGQFASTAAVQRGLGELLAFYSARGYLKAQITPDVQPDPTGTRATVVYTINPGEQARVSKFDINVRGERLDFSKLPHAIAEGQPFSASAVQDAMDRLRDLYLNQDYLGVRVNQDITPDVNTNSVAVAIAVVSGPKISVTVEGLDIGKDQMRKTLPFYRQGGVDNFSLEEGARRLQEYAQSKGYFFARVTRPQAPRRTQTEATLVYKVEPFARYRLTDIEIDGVDAIPHRTLEDQLKTKVASPLPLIGNRQGLTSDDYLRQDANTIQKRLREQGYRRAHVDVRRGVSPTGNRLIITFDVQQGPRSYVEDVAIRGNNVLTGYELRQGLEAKPGEPLVASVVTNDTERLLAAYTTRGYASAEVVSEVVELGSFDGQDRVRLLFNVNEGNRVRIHSVMTRGTAYTDTGRLERDFYLFKPGDWLRNDQLQETEQQLYDTNAFNSVSISSETVNRAANNVEERDVTVNLLEAKRRDLLFGFGYQANVNTKTIPGLSFLHGLRGLTQLTYYDLFGKLYTGSTQIRVAENELFGQISLQNPRPFGTRFPTVVSLFARRLGERDFRSDRYTASIQSERRITPELIVFASYNFERISVFDLPCTLSEVEAGDCPGLSLEEIQRNSRPIRLGRIGPSFAYDTRDNKFDPTAGMQTLGSFYFASSALGGNEQFIKLSLEHNRYYALRRFRDTVYSLSGRLGLATPFGGKTSLPISERFFAGGARDLRGFGFEEAGPTILVPQRDTAGNIIRNDDGTPKLMLSPLGGNAVLVINNELRFPIWRSLGGAVFSDTGNVFQRVRDMKPSNLTQTFGLGVRVKTPVGPVRFDVGFLVFNRPPGYGSYHLHFTIGQTF